MLRLNFGGPTVDTIDCRHWHLTWSVAEWLLLLPRGVNLPRKWLWRQPKRFQSYSPRKAIPVKQGLVPSLNRPGGNATGVTFFGTPLVAKRLEVLHQLVPKASLIAMLINPSNPLAEPEAREAQDAGLRLGLQLFVVRVSTERDFERAFESMIERRPGAFCVGADQVFNSDARLLLRWLLATDCQPYISCANSPNLAA